MPVMIVLTEAQAKAMTGETAPGHRLEPVPLKDGTYMLPTEALTDPAHAIEKTGLSALPTKNVLVANMYDDTDADRAAFKTASDLLRV